MIDSVELMTGVSILAVTPALVEVAKQSGLPTQWAGIAAIAIATVMVIAGGIALGDPLTLPTISRWLMNGIVYGLAAAGLYSQTRPGGKPPLAAA